jgi:peptidoglycan/xylan/chitin deacetylase (PgdA/CDA1 family)
MFLALLGIGVVSASGCAARRTDQGAGLLPTTTPAIPTTVPEVLPPSRTPFDNTAGPTIPTTTTRPPPTVPPIPGPQPGPPVVVMHAPSTTQQIAITIDDGYCDECVSGYVDFAERSGVSLTFSPNGSFSDIWNRYASRLRPLIAAGQVQMGNHTWSHPNIVTLGDAAIRTEIQRNEDWLQTTFGVTGRPWFRPPYGSHTAHTDTVAASLGYTRILMWNATLGDATLETPEVLMAMANQWVKPGSIVLGHANYPTVLHLFDQLQALIASRGLQPVTLDAMFGTTRATG